MKLAEWLELTKTKAGDFAAQVKVSASTVHRYLFEGVIPKPDIMRRIYIATQGAVTANDFYELIPSLYIAKGDTSHAIAHA